MLQEKDNGSWRLEDSFRQHFSFLNRWEQPRVMKQGKKSTISLFSKVQLSLFRAFCLKTINKESKRLVFCRLQKSKSYWELNKWTEHRDNDDIIMTTKQMSNNKSRLVLDSILFNHVLLLFKSVPDRRPSFPS
jgi:hypothetical protein